MPVLSHIDISLSSEEVEEIPGLHRQGHRGRRLHAMVIKILREIEQDGLIVPAVSYNVVGVATVGSRTLALDNGAVLQAPLLARRMARASSLALGIATIGNRAGNTITRLFESRQGLKAVLLEEIANRYLLRTSEYLQLLIDTEAGEQCLQASGPSSPGDRGFAISEQDRVLALAGAAKVGIHVTSAGMMKPRHSLSVVIGLGKRMRRWSQRDNCAICRARASCSYRHSSCHLAA